MTEAFQKFRAVYVPLVEKEMTGFLEKHTANDYLKESMLYSIQAGGKRLRPLLVIAAVLSFGKELEKEDCQVAAALEMIHTYSLIHDDLPAMDDDDLRRGKPTNHKVYGEAHAILAGDGLLTAAIQLIAISQLDMSKKVLLIQQLTRAAGTQGMVAGQAGDLQGETRSLSLEELVEVHEAKTGALIEFALIAGGILADQTEVIIELLSSFARYLGLAFQIRDDLLDVTSSEEELGKQVGRDETLNKSTYPGLLGIEGAAKEFEQQMKLASEKLAEIQACNNEFQPMLLENILKQLALQ
ncbi:polyprenyl synthetase family protein [Enterococcus sp. CWB-B31]|uniref:polyprenyl synthetase family protein n=1 Tax=Enterococcus sp. CWB-B31 TaxID=2885159 RepID=UPI001E4B4CDE|nr:farnesyl diphosphate synthase [Enterococcus sp. CWB-B31]MCB5956177.1 polyprenyl synthetase family protein [Enterococcus sp. CWB-B31]